MENTLAYLLPKAATVGTSSRIFKTAQGRQYVSFAHLEECTWTIPHFSKLYQSQSLSLNIEFSTNTTVGDVDFSASLEVLVDGDMTTDTSYGDLTPSSPQSLTGGANTLQSFTCTFSDVDGLVPGCLVRVKLVRNTDTCVLPVLVYGATLVEDTPSFALDGALTLGTPLEIASGGTGASDAYSALNNLLPDQTGMDGSVLQTNSGSADWFELGDLAFVDAPLQASQGGTGLTSLTANRVLYAAQIGGQMETSADFTFTASTKRLDIAGFQVITNQSASTIPFRVHGAASQSGLLTDWRNSSNTSLASVSSSGGITGATIAGSNLVSTRIPFATTGGQLTDSDRLTWDGSLLNITGNGAPGFKLTYTGTNKTWYVYNGAGGSGNLSFYDMNNSADRMVIKSDGSIDFGNSFGSPFMSMSNTGKFGIGITATAQLHVSSSGASTVPLSVKHASTPSVDFFNVLDSSNVKVFAVSSDKTLLLPPASSNGNPQTLTWKTDGTQWGNAELQIQRNSSSNNGLGTQLKLTDNGVSAYIKFFSRSFTQGVNDLEFWSQGGLNISMPYTGGTYIYNPVTNTQYPALLTAPAQTIAVGGGAPSPIGAFVFEAITYGATSSNSVTDSASLLIKSAPIQGTNMTLSNRYGGLILTGSATAKGLAIRGAASQSANLQEWQDSSSTILAALKSNGAFQPASLADSSAANGTIYYSTTSSKLCFKDSGGTTHDLY